MKIKTFSQAKDFLYQQIPKEAKKKFPGQLGLKRTKYLLSLLGNPQNKLKVIHLAGTSGKGSTAYLISLILKNLGFKTGLHLSPHLIDIRERFQINNQLVPENQFCRFLNDIIPAVNQVKKTDYGSPTYFEILVALSFFIFWRKKVDYAVMETGLGGQYDATNCLREKNKLVVLTKIGIDHSRILGRTLDKIAFQKAKVIQRNNLVLSLWQKPIVRKVFEKITQEQKARLFYIKQKKNIKNIKTSLYKTSFDFCFQDLKLAKIDLKLVGLHQAENCALALAAVWLLSKRDRFKADKAAIRKALLKADFLGRMTILKTPEKIIIIDGAHNPQKMSALIKSLKRLYPKTKIGFLVAFLPRKDYLNMLKHITPKASKIFITGFGTRQDSTPFSENPYMIGRTLKNLNFNNYTVVNDLNEAFCQGLKTKTNPLVITGSLYLVGRVLKQFKNLTVSSSINPAI